MMKSLTFNDCYKEKLFSIPLFSELPDYLKSEILKRLDFRLQEINENTVILEQGDICCNLYVLLEGTLEVNIIDANGNEILIEHIESPRAFATPHLFKKDNRFPATFRTLEKSVLLTATKDSTFHLISKYPDMLKKFSLRIRQLQRVYHHATRCAVTKNHSRKNPGLFTETAG